jgi:hypothetical protein
MSFQIGVHRIEDEPLMNSPPLDAGRDQLEAWLADCVSRSLYDAPLGADGDVFDWFHAPATELGLKLLGRLYHHGLNIGADDLRILEAEVAALERYQEAKLTKKKRALFMERLGFLREAIDIAAREDAVLTIG